MKIMAYVFYKENIALNSYKSLVCLGANHVMAHILTEKDPLVTNVDHWIPETCWQIDLLALY